MLPSHPYLFLQTDQTQTWQLSMFVGITIAQAFDANSPMWIVAGLTCARLLVALQHCGNIWLPSQAASWTLIPLSILRVLQGHRVRWTFSPSLLLFHWWWVYISLWVIHAGISSTKWRDVESFHSLLDNKQSDICFHHISRCEPAEFLIPNEFDFCVLQFHALL